MDTHEHARPARMREQPPPWPRRNVGDRPGDARREREREPFEDNVLPELYPGSLVMEDLVVTHDDKATLRVLARYTCARVLVMCLSGELTAAKLRMEKRITLEHLALLPDYDWERRALERVIVACTDEPARDIIEIITSAAEAAAKRSQVMGSFVFYRAAWELAVKNEWWPEGAQVARGIAQLARLEEASYSIRLWRRRAAVLEARATRTSDARAAGLSRSSGQIP
ncbi:MAG TPA: hypothetical protein VK912_00115 [Longimicrobiales bacterium]|nr:hypothetical protein [Longimicrobiales bacterium]